MEERRWEDAICGFLTINEQGEILSINKTMLDLLAYEVQEDLLLRNIDLLLSSSAQFFYYSMLYPKIQMEGFCQEIYLTLKTRRGADIPVMFNARKFQTEKGEVIDCIILPMKVRQEYLKEIKSINKKLESALEEKTKLHDALIEKQNELEETYEKLKEISRQDPLTGIANRRAFMESLYEAVSHGTPFSLCILDLDFFKAVNDQFGHHTGDEVLRAFAAHLSEFFKDVHPVGRFGGEEFTVLLRNLGREESVIQMEAFRSAVHGRTYGGLSISVSFGLATMGKEEDTDTLLVKADMALYEAKRRGRDCVLHYHQISDL